MQCPTEEVVSKVMQSHWPTKTPTCEDRNTKTKKTIDSTDKIKESVYEQLQALPPNGPYVISVQLDDGPYDVASFFRKAIYYVLISVHISPNAQLTVSILFDTGRPEFSE